VRQFSILDASHPETAYFCEQGCENPRLFFEDNGIRDQKCLGNAEVEEGSARSRRTTCRGKRRIRSGRIFQE